MPPQGAESPLTLGKFVPKNAVRTSGSKNWLLDALLVRETNVFQSKDLGLLVAIGVRS